jgi:hypothetical protein
MAKPTVFPVKRFEIRGSALTESQRIAAVRNAMKGEYQRVTEKPTKAVKKGSKSAQGKKAAIKLKYSKTIRLLPTDTATGSGRVVFSFSTRPLVAAKKRA